MKNFAYYKPGNVKEAARLLTDNKTKNAIWGGGTDLLGMMKDRLTEPDGVVDIKGLPGLERIDYKSGQGLTIGAAARLTEVASHPAVRQHYPILAQAILEVASPQLRNQGTIGGNLCQRPRCWYFRGEYRCLRKGGDVCYAVEGRNKYHCVVGGAPCFIIHPSDCATVLTALGASVRINGTAERTVKLDDFFLLPEKDVLRENVLKKGEVITAVHVPDVNDRTHGVFLKMKERGVWDFANVSVAVLAETDNGVIRSGRIILGGVAPVPWREREAERALTGLKPSPNAFHEVAALMLRNAEPMNENEYKIIMARNLTERALSMLKF